MEDRYTLEKDILQNIGDASKFELNNVLDDTGDEDEIDLVKHSPYFTFSNLPPELQNNNNNSNILTLNVQSLNAKYDTIQSCLHMLNSNNYHFKEAV